jgi:hypothetical protein
MSQLLKVFSACMIAFLISLLGGCATSGLVDKWYDDTGLTAPLGRILVIAVRKDEVKRRIWEDAFTGELAGRGVAATSSYRLFPGTPPDTNQIAATVKSVGIDGILVIRKLPTEKDQHYKKGGLSIKQDDIYDAEDVPYMKRYWSDYDLVVHPGYVDTQTVVVRAIDVVTTGKNGHVIWSATSRTPDPGSIVDIQKRIAGLVVSELVRRKVIGTKK